MGVFKRTRVTKDGGSNQYWYIRYRVNGEDKYDSVGRIPLVTKTQARTLLEDRRRQVRLGQFDMIKTKIPTLMEFSGEYLAYVRNVVQKRSWSRDELSLKHLNGFFGDRRLSEITPKDIDDYKESRLASVAPATVNRELEVLKHSFNLADRWGKFFGKNPVSRAGMLPLNNQVERILTCKEEERLLEVSPSHLGDIIICALNTGMRKGEVLSLRWDNIDLENGVITLQASNTKSKRIRKIPTNSTLRTTLLKLRLKTSGSEYVFLSSDDKPYTRQDSLNRVFIGALNHAGIKGLRFHDLRHTFATRAVESGCSIVALSKVLGHADIKTTMRYAHPDNSINDLVEKVANFGKDGYQSGYQKNQA